MGIRKKHVNEFPTPYTCTAAIREGGMETKLSMVLMGFGNIMHKQKIKGLIYLAVEVAYVVFMVLNGIRFLSMLGTLGTVEQKEVWDEVNQIYTYTKGDQSVLILLYGVATILVTILMIWAWRGALKSAYKAECLDREGRHVNSFVEDVKALLHENLHRLLMTPPMVFIFALTILPLIFMICMAFTNYSKIDNHLMLFEWVGLDNFRALFDSNSILGSTFWSVLAWTIVWAFFATFSNYIFGMILSIVINRKETRAKGFWRFCFVLSCAVPMFVSLLIMRTMLQPEGAVNVLLRNLGLIAQDASLPFFTDPMWARVTVIVINIWVGVPYTLLQLTGVLQNIPGELYEAAKVDGANAVQIFFKITLPYMLYVTTPYLITTFTGNVNNFNIIYLLSGGDPVTDLSSTAGSTDLLVTWLYKLTIDKQYYNIGAVIGILTFIILAIAALLTYRNSKSYKEEGGILNMAAGKVRSAKKRRFIHNTIVHVVLAILALIWVFPILWVILTSFRAEKGSYVSTFFPQSFTLDNYVRLFTDTSILNFPQMFANTLFIAVCSCILSTFYVLAVSYCLSRLKFKLRKPYMNMAMILGLFPGFMSMVAVYFILKAIGLTEGNLIKVALILCYSGGAGLGFQIAKGFFDTIPIAVDEAALLDGCTRWQIFSRITLPLSKPIIIYTVLTSFMAPWLDFIFAKVICRANSDQYTIAIGLWKMLEKEYIDSWYTSFAAGAVLISIPIAILFLFMQRYYVDGVSGAVKG